MCSKCGERIAQRRKFIKLISNVNDFLQCYRPELHILFTYILCISTEKLKQNQKQQKETATKKKKLT